MSDLDDDNDGFGVVDQIEHSVVPLAEAKLLPAGKFFTTGWARLRCKASDLRDQALAALQGDGLDFLGCGGSDLQPIVCHGA